jgi:hypothetical protein
MNKNPRLLEGKMKALLTAKGYELTKVLGRDFIYSKEL